MRGYDDLQADEGARRRPRRCRDCGRSILTIEVILTDPFAIFPLTLGYSAFNPLPEAFYADPAAFGKKPVGNGPFKADTAGCPVAA